MIEPLTKAPLPPALLGPEEAVDLAGTLTTWRTVDRRLVHKTALTEVLVTDLRPLGEDLFALASQWPRQHALFQPSPDEAPNPLLFVETLRQAGIYLSHERLGVPLDHQFVFESISAEYLRPGPRPRTDRETVVVLAVRTDVRRRAGRASGARLEIEAWAGPERIATAVAAYRCLPPQVYGRLRWSSLATTPPPALPAPRRSAESVAQPQATSALLDVDTRHPTFFDHGGDHLPGMLLIDAALSAARPAHVASDRPWGFDLRFERFAELGVPTTVTTRPTPAGVAVALTQPAGVVAAGTVSGGYPAAGEPASAGPVAAVGRS
ncbi:ScbA/BarX family gamma-butyrolactone biosynthesis protein [Blastococcus sp. TF02A-35]|uniref:ScbA/BarX family gamma-butyrolactone biosynthesis protein n=1 Tax=Blastococcus sp. TF02A-35 TaxID=2559612 RepID=UPI0010730116|nr:ScbA/BarX family gamma-butyrolactone biosynthesis protein [Blastococcus sp. TF02A_35]TFV52789.1 hypothetical protein E4P43_04080 [Blastococcus sp. TF02A_35]